MYVYVCISISIFKVSVSKVGFSCKVQHLICNLSAVSLGVTLQLESR